MSDLFNNNNNPHGETDLFGNPQQPQPQQPMNPHVQPGQQEDLFGNPQQQYQQQYQQPQQYPQQYQQPYPAASASNDAFIAALLALLVGIIGALIGYFLTRDKSDYDQRMGSITLRFAIEVSVAAMALIVGGLIGGVIIALISEPLAGLFGLLVIFAWIALIGFALFGHIKLVLAAKARTLYAPPLTYGASKLLN